MNPKVTLACEPNDICLKFGEIWANLQDGRRVAVVHEGTRNNPTSLEFRPADLSDRFKCVAKARRPENERVTLIQLFIDRIVLGMNGPQHENMPAAVNPRLEQAFRDIETDRAPYYDRFFSLQIFKGKEENTLNWLPLIYLKLRLKRGSFDPVYPSMKYRVSRLRDKARFHPDEADGLAPPDLRLVSSAQEQLAAHSELLLQSDVIRRFQHPQGQIGVIHCPNISSRVLHLFLDIIYGAENLANQSANDIAILYNVAKGFEYKKLQDAAYRCLSNKLGCYRSVLERKGSL